MKWLAVSLLPLIVASVATALTITVPGTSSNDGPLITEAARIMAEVWNTYSSTSDRLQFLSLGLSEVAAEPWYALTGEDAFYIPPEQDYISLKVQDLLIVRYFTVISARCLTKWK